MWTLLLGHELHYGLFEHPGEDLTAATGRLTAIMIEAARIGPKDRVLDVGCGTGAPACRVARELRARVTGISTSGAGVDAARARAAAEGLTALVSFERRDGTANRFEPQSFDRVLALESSHLMRDRQALISECARVLAPGGRLALCDIVLRRALGFAEVRRLRTELWLLREVFGDARMEPVPEYCRLMEAAGLAPDTELDLTSATRPTFAHWRANAERHRNEVSAVLGDHGLQQFIAACEVLERLWDDGTLGYALIAAARLGS